jgi:tellurite resistance protein
MTSLWSDLGNGKFDGANLVSGFEDLNPANTIWTKQYNVWANVDTEEDRYLNFEKWWGGFFKMNREEIHFIVDSLFVGNELEQGKLRLEEDHWVNLKNFKDPIVVFASQGDNITPPQQALNWIYKVYKTVDEIKRNGQVIVYIVHPKIGHLGIFVGSKIAKKEHSAIIGTVDMIEYLAPGLYEMVITDESSDTGEEERVVEFVERSMDDILDLDDGLEDEVAFGAVSAISRLNDKMYLSYLSPVVRSMVNESTAETIRQLHPLRTQRYLLSDQNPMLWPYKYMAPFVKENRHSVKDDNIFMQWEKKMSDAIITSLNGYRDYRDNFIGSTFRFIYENPWMETLFPEEQKGDEGVVDRVDPLQEKIEKELWAKAMVQGGFEAAVIRIVLAVSGADHSIDQREFLVTREIIEKNEKLSKLKPKELKQLTKEQAALVSYDLDEAINTLPKLITKKVERQEALEVAHAIAAADLEIDEKEKEVLDKICNALNL